MILIRLTSIPLFIGRLVICSIILFFIYLKYGPPNYVEAEAINEVFYLFLIPLMLISGTIVVCLLVGSPLMFIPKVNKWWHSNSYIAFIGLAIGFLIILFGSNYTDTIIIMEKETEIIKEMPNETILGFGWFMTAFFYFIFIQYFL